MSVDLVLGKIEKGRRTKSHELTAHFPPYWTMPPNAIFKSQLLKWYDRNNKTIGRRPLVAWAYKLNHKLGCFGAGFTPDMNLEDRASCIICHEPIAKSIK